MAGYGVGTQSCGHGIPAHALDAVGVVGVSWRAADVWRERGNAVLMRAGMSWRCSIGLAGAGLLLAALPALAQTAAAPPSILPRWTAGWLDIHHLATGRGNSTLIICPDGTTVLIDAGAASGGSTVTTPPRPDGSRRPGEWIARYIGRWLPATGRNGLDYFVAT